MVAGKRLRCSRLAAELAELPALQLLDLKCNALNSSVPAEWRAAGAFPALMHLNLGEPAKQAGGRVLAAAVAAFASAAAGWGRCIASCTTAAARLMLPQPPPPAAQPCPRLAAPRRAADNLLTGSLSDYTRPDGSPLAAQVFNLSRNVLDDGPLPAAWHSPTLRVLDVSYNRVRGGLPAAWAAPAAGQRSAFPRLELLAVQGNALEGQYPYGNGSAFAANFSVTARPGNGLLEGVPAPPPAPTTGSSSDVSGGAIAGIVVGCVAAAGGLEAGVFRGRLINAVLPGRPRAAPC